MMRRARFDVPFPHIPLVNNGATGAGFTTTNSNRPGVRNASVSSVNRISVGLTTCVGTGLPLKCTIDRRTKLIPLTVTVAGAVEDGVLCVTMYGSNFWMAGCGELAGSATGDPAPRPSPSAAAPPPRPTFIKATTHGNPSTAGLGWSPGGLNVVE